jgi:hypothetical protein
MAWSRVAPTCVAPPRRSGIISLAPGATQFTIDVDAPPVPYPYFLMPNWNTGFFDVFVTSLVMAAELGTPAPADGSGTISWMWEDVT